MKRSRIFVVELQVDVVFMESSTQSFPVPLRAVVIGGRRGLGAALVDQILQDSSQNQVVSTSRHPEWDAHGARPRERRFVLDVTNEADF